MQANQPNYDQEAMARRIVLASGFLAFISFGIRLSFSVFFAEFVAAEGWSNESAAGIFSVSMLVFAVGSTPAGILLDKYGPRIVFTSGILCLALGLFMSSQVNTSSQLMLTYGIVGGVGITVVGLGPIAANIAAWVPPSARGRAFGVAFAGTGLGSLIFVPLSRWMIAEYGWRNAYIVLALICVFILAPILLYVMRSPQRHEREHSMRDSGKALIRNPIFWLLMVISFTALGPLRSLTVHQVAYIESTGIDRSIAANYVGLAGFLTFGSFLIWGWASDRFGRAVVFTLGAMSLASAVGILFWLPDAQDSNILIGYAVFYALAEGTRSSQTTALASDTFESAGLGLINGMVGALFGLGAAFGPWVVGRLRDSTGSYDLGLITVLILVTVSVVGFLGVEFLKNREQSRMKAAKESA